MADLELLQKRAVRNAFATHNYIEMEALEPDRAVFRLTIRPESCNPFGIAHGGAFYTLADNAAGLAVHSDGRSHVTQSSNLNFLGNRPVGDTIRAEARVRRRGRTTSLVEVDITDDGGELLATGQFTFFCIRQDPLIPRG